MATRAPATRDVVRVTLTVAALAATLYLLYVVRGVVLLVVLAAFLAIALGPAVDRVQRGGRMPRPLAILVVYVALIALLVGIGLLVVPPVVDQGEALARDVPGYVQDLRENDTLRDLDERYGLIDKVQEQADELPARLGDAAGALSGIAAALVNVAFQTVTILTLAFLLLLNGGRIVAFGLRAAGPEREARFRPLAGDIYRSTGGYVAGAMTLGTISGLGTLLVLSLLGVPFSVPLAVVMAAFTLIPLVGATIGAVVVGVVTLFQDFPTDTIVWVVYAIVYQQLENNLLQPLVYRRTVDVPPLAVVVGVLVGASLLGVVGALLAIPVAAALQILLRDWWRRREAPPQLRLDEAPGHAADS